MPKLQCKCGFIAPSPEAGWVVIKSTDYEKVVDSGYEGFDLTGSLYQCPD